LKAHFAPGKPATLIDELIDAFRCLPGVGPKSAQRMAFHLLERDRERGRKLAQTMAEAMDRIGHCSRCRTLSEATLCALCSDARRNPRVLCVVESPTDMAAVAASSVFDGYFFVLMGQLSPLDGIGPEQLGLSRLTERLSDGEVEELILATGATVEGQATAHYISEMVAGLPVRVTRIAQGVPLGGELEYVDGNTLAHAITGRRDYSGT
jgi:recombination protein RecR